MKSRILIICTGNSCRSQMAEGVLKGLDKELEVFSAGTEPASAINPYAVRVMKEIGIDISGQYPKNIGRFLSESFDYVITVCDNAKETCPVFSGEVKHNLHYSIPDPARTAGSEEDKLKVYRRVRDRINEIFTGFFGEISGSDP